MGFWHIAFLAGAATFAIPVIIHLMFRLRKRRLIFSSLRFLQQSTLRQSQRLRLRELLLLLLRCAACILIALAFARPFRSNSASAGGSQIAEDVALVLDDSPSLMAQEGTNVRWPALLEKTRQEVMRHPGGDRVALILASEPSRAEIELSGNFGAIRSALQRNCASSRRGDLGQALNSAIELLATSRQPARRIVVYSDWQANQIDRGVWAEAAQKAAAAGRGITVQLETPFEVKPGRLANLAVTDARPKSDIWIEGHPVPFAVRVSNYGDGEHPNVVVKLMVNGQSTATRSLALGPRSSQEFELTALFPRSGEVFGSVEIEAADAFPDDDKRFFALRLRDSLRALVIEERLNEKDAFLDEGYYVRMALDPKIRAADTFVVGSASAVTVQNYVQTQAITTAQITSEICRQADIIILAGIFALKETELVALEEAVRDGRNLILFTGRSDGRLSETFYNGPFWKNGLGLLPARPGPLYEGNRLEGKYHKVGDFKTEHPVFKIFTDENESFLRLPWFTRHFQANAADLKIGAEATSITQSTTEAERQAGRLRYDQVASATSSATELGVEPKTHPP
ncbi:MAG: BatA and WFA domain-containing protein, partial [Planctomycetota bacterium]